MRELYGVKVHIFVLRTYNAVDYEVKTSNYVEILHFQRADSLS